jgi:hypothetical protein
MADRAFYTFPSEKGGGGAAHFENKKRIGNLVLLLDHQVRGLLMPKVTIGSHFPFPLACLLRHLLCAVIISVSDESKACTLPLSSHCH